MSVCQLSFIMLKGIFGRRKKTPEQLVKAVGTALAGYRSSAAGSDAKAKTKVHTPLKGRRMSSSWCCLVHAHTTLALLELSTRSFPLCQAEENLVERLGAVRVALYGDVRALNHHQQTKHHKHPIKRYQVEVVLSETCENVCVSILQAEHTVEVTNATREGISQWMISEGLMLDLVRHLEQLPFEVCHCRVLCNGRSVRLNSVTCCPHPVAHRQGSMCPKFSATWCAAMSLGSRTLLLTSTPH